MQLDHNITLVQESFFDFAQLSHSLDDKVKVAEARTEIIEKLLKVYEEWEIKFWEELTASLNAIQELEAWVVKKKDIITKRRAYAIELEANLSDAKRKLQFAKE